MRWLECIRLRTAQAKAEKVAGDLEAHLAGLQKEAGLIWASFYKGIRPDGDFNLALLWNTDRVESGGSHVARRLIPIFRNHGLVNYSVWAEKEEAFVRGKAWGDLHEPADTQYPEYA